jgi:hypothetical protein
MSLVAVAALSAALPTAAEILKQRTGVASELPRKLVHACGARLGLLMGLALVSRSASIRGVPSYRRRVSDAAGGGAVRSGA